MLHELDLWDVELAILPWAITDTRVSDSLLVSVKLLEVILQVPDGDSGLTSVLGDGDEVLQCTHGSQYPTIDKTSEYAQEDSLQCFGLLSRMLTVPGEAIWKMATADPRLQSSYAPVQFFGSSPPFCPLEDVGFVEFMPLMKSIRCKKQARFSMPPVLPKKHDRSIEVELLEQLSFFCKIATII